MAEEHKYKMTISLNVLYHLGLNLYSNIPAVLSEIVANSFDADATKVEISIDVEKDIITIKDNGIGMTCQDINEKFLYIGYDRRKVSSPITDKGRHVMGRKGIGKLSVFSIANDIEVLSVKNGEKNGLRMSVTKIKEAIEQEKEVLKKATEGKSENEVKVNKFEKEEKGVSDNPDLALSPYFPEVIEESEIDISDGTKIILKNLNKNINRTDTFLRKRLARRFSLIGKTLKDKDGKPDSFEIYINNEPISPKDRDYYNNIEFLWCLGKDSEFYKDRCTKLEKYETLENIVDDENGYSVHGWVGTIDEQSNINEDDEVNSILLYANGKLIQEDVLKDFKEGGLYSKYLIGEIDADFLDLDEKDDIVTSDRQRIKEGDPRYLKLKEYVQNKILKRIQSKWTEWRLEGSEEKATQNPTINKWYNGLKGDNKKIAKNLFGKIESLKFDNADSKKELYKASILAFEKLAIKQNLSALNEINSETQFDLLKNIFKGIDEIEEVHYSQIIKSRIDVISKFKDIVDDDVKEKVLQEYIFDHLWLLDSSWERASTNLRIEETIKKEFDTIDASLTTDEKQGRVDIRYKTAAGKHIIIELKRYNRNVNVHDLNKQMSKYKNALTKCLKEKFPTEPRIIECIAILGSPPEPKENEQENIGILAAAHSRFITYDTLIKQTLESYKDYFEKAKEVSDILDIIDKL
jgi:hypothetical protein